MLKKTNEGGVESNTGFSIQITGPELLEYRHNGKIIDIDLSYDPKKRKIYIYASSIKELNETAKKQMINNIKEAVQLLKGDFEIV